MTNIPESISEMEYPGRLLAAGLGLDGRAIIVYMITGRSVSSQAREIVADGPDLKVRPTDEELLRKGNPDLLVYRAVAVGPSGAVVSNGKQTDGIAAALAPGLDPKDVLRTALKTWDFEPDAPIFTPRISGCLNGRGLALSSLLRGPDGATLREYYDLPLKAGRGFMISTYSGPNSDPLPVSDKGPREVAVTESDPFRIVEAVYAAMAPADGRKDFRVGAACLAFDLNDPARFRMAVKNRHEQERKD